jgi:hypothetical protein
MSEELYKRFDKYVIPEPNSGCWLWMGPVQKGYGALSRGRRGEGMVRAHRVSYERAYGPIPDGMHVLHKCDVRPCVNPEHLFIGTNKDNLADMAAKGRSCHGEKHYQGKLSAVDVVEIRASSESQRALARRYGVTQALISRIQSRQTWARLP